MDALYSMPAFGLEGHSDIQWLSRGRDPVMEDILLGELELRRFNGERGARVYIAHMGIVYDVTDCPKWRSGEHEHLHFSGQDLTFELPDAPHGEEVFSRPCVRRVGRVRSLPPSAEP
jgi:predicted heme/steroid binding protein